MELKKIFARNKTIFLILLLAFVLRIYGLNTMGMGVDENLTIMQAQDFSKIAELGKTIEFSPPLYYLIVFTIFQIFQDLFFVRVFSAIMGVLLIFLVYFVAKEFFGEKTALLAAFLTAINPNLIAYSHLMRNYEFFFVLIFSVIIFTKKYIGTGKNLANLAVSNILLMLTTYLGFLVFAAECLALKLNKAKNRIIIGLAAAVGLFLLPIILTLAKRTQDYNSIFAGRYFFNIEKIAVDFAYMLYKFSIGGITIKTAIGISPILLIVVPVILLLFLKGLWIDKNRFNILHYFLFIPAVIAFSISLFGSPIFHYKYSSYLLPIFLIFTAKGLSEIKNKRLQRVLFAIIVVCWFAAIMTFYSISTADGWNAYLGV